MKTPLISFALAAALVAPALAQVPALTPTPPSRNLPMSRGNAPAPRDANVFRTGDELPEPKIVDGNPSIPLPNGPIEPYLLGRENGPFMVMAHTFRGPEADRCALALVLELRHEYHPPAYVFPLK